MKQRLSSYYLGILEKISYYYINSQNYTRAEKHLLNILSADPYNEDIATLLIRVYFELQNKMGIVKIYDNLKNSLKNDLNILPSKNLTKFYKDSLNTL